MRPGDAKPAASRAGTFRHAVAPVGRAPPNMLTEIASFTAFTSLACWSIWVFRRQQRIIRDVQRQKVRIQTEERRVFDFLHSIGEALTHESRPGDLHGSIVEGALGILEANGGVLYLADKSGSTLHPVYVSKNCP